MEKVLLMQDTLQACEFAMLQMQFTEEEKNALHHERFHNPHPRVQQRMEALLLKSHALPPAKIASTLKMDEGALRSYLQDYQQGGIEQLKIINLIERFWKYVKKDPGWLIDSSDPNQ